MIIHYNCTIGSFLLHSFLLIYHPYPPSFHEMIFTLVFIVFLHIHYALVATCTCVWALLMDYHRVLCVDIHTVLDRTDM